MGLSQKAYINKVLESMDKCYASSVPIQKGDELSLKQCPQIELERKQIEHIPYASVFGSLMYARHVSDQTLFLRSVCWADIKVILEWIIGELQRKC